MPASSRISRAISGVFSLVFACFLSACSVFGTAPPEEPIVLEPVVEEPSEPEIPLVPAPVEPTPEPVEPEEQGDAEHAERERERPASVAAPNGGDRGQQGGGGLGFYIWSSYMGGTVAQVIVGMISIGIAGYLSSSLIRYIGTIAMPWRRLF